MLRTTGGVFPQGWNPGVGSADVKYAGENRPSRVYPSPVGIGEPIHAKSAARRAHGTVGQLRQGRTVHSVHHLLQCSHYFVGETATLEWGSTGETLHIQQ